ncbi:MAG: FKBP-type peptidyl-prolyl cis-trans isomerase [Candidatus Pacebacteria bacterium]|nr:FKBP-type peptidyl-prolyl cis-trans isomerase [Candidatus Paceibacterota bacterium]
MKKNWYILLLISIGFVIGIIIFIFANDREMNPNGWQDIQGDSINNMIDEIQKPLDINVLKEGSGQEIKNGDMATVHYTGTLENGTKFDSSLDRGEPFSFQLGAGKVIRGWDEGVLGMKAGEKRKLIIQPEYGYGDRAIASIPANSVLIFEVELLKIN